MLAAVARLGGPVEINPSRRRRLDDAARRGRRACNVRPDQVAAYFAAATQAALVLAALRAPYRGRSTPVNAWWGSFDLAVSLFSGQPVEAVGGGLHHAQRRGCRAGRDRVVARRCALPESGLLRLRVPAARGVRGATLAPSAARWDATLGEYILDWDDIRAGRTRIEDALEFARSAVEHGCAVCRWEPDLPSASRESRRRSRDGSEARTRQAHDRPPSDRPMPDRVRGLRASPTSRCAQPGWSKGVSCSRCSCRSRDRCSKCRLRTMRPPQREHRPHPLAVEERRLARGADSIAGRSRLRGRCTPRRGEPDLG